MNDPSQQDQQVRLPAVQRWFQSVVTHPGGIEAGAASDAAMDALAAGRDDLEQVVTRSRSLTATERLAIYANAFHTRLIECLGDSYPVLKRTLGEEVFNGFAFGYLQSYPSTSYTLSLLGKDFSRFLDQTRPTHKRSEVGWPDFLVDLAHLEWTIGEVFDSPGIERIDTLNESSLAAIPPDHWPSLRLETVPCLRLLALRFPLNEYYTAMRATNPDERVGLPAPAETYIAISRREYIVRRQDLTRPQFLLLQALQDGETLSMAIEWASQAMDIDDRAWAANLQEWFRDWTARQYFHSAKVTTSIQRK